MTPERAIEILNPEHREHYKNIETVNEACRMGMEAIGYRIKKKPIFDDETAAYYCPNCKKAQAYAVDDFSAFCELCGQAIDKSSDWSDEE